MFFLKNMPLIIWSIILLSGNALSTTVVFLQGTSCAGKTSLCKELVKLDSRWKCVSEDDLFYEQVPLRCKRLFPIQYEVISKAIAYQNMFHAIVRDQVLFKIDASEQEKNDALHAISEIRNSLDSREQANLEINREWKHWMQGYIVSRINAFTDLGFNVIVENWFVNPQQYQAQFKNNNIIIVLAYSPLRDIVERTFKRNAESLNSCNWSPIRFFHQTLMAFKGQFELIDCQSIENKKHISIDSISKHEVDQILNYVQQNLVESKHAVGSQNPFSRGEFSKETFSDYRTTLLSSFSYNEWINLASKTPYDLLIYTNKYLPVEYAHTVLDFCNNQN